MSSTSSAAALPSVGGPSRASAIGERLDAARRAVEGKFLEAGDVLAGAIQGVDDLIASLDRMVATLAPGVIKATTDELRDAAANLSMLPDAHGERRDRLEQLAGTADALTGRIVDMRQDLAYLRVFAINIKITAGGIAAAGEEFGIFAQEIHDCIDLGRTKLDAFADDVTALRAELQLALGHGESLGRSFDEMLPAVPDALTGSATAMAEHHQRIAGVAGEVAALARNVQKKVAGALSALQIGDITRQRIEHVQAGLEMLTRLDRDPATGLGSDQRRRLTAAVHGLLAAQLSATAEDFHREVDRVATAMSGIAHDASEILRLRDLAYGRPKDGEGGFLRTLESNVARALELVGAMETAEQGDLDAGRAAADAARELTTSIAGIQAIRVDVQQMALNTTLKCSRIGDTGKPLAVIAIELRVHAGRLEESAGATLGTLNDLTQVAGLLSGAGVGATQAGAAARALDGATTRIHDAGDAVEADLAALATRGAAVVEALNRAAASLNLRAEIGGALDRAADELATLAGADPVETHDIAAPLSALLADLAKQYTMAQEREVHQAMADALIMEDQDYAEFEEAVA